MTRLELETSALPRRRSTDWATSAIQVYKPDKKHSIMMTYVCQLNFAKFSKNTNNYRILFSQNKCCVIMAGYVKCMFHLLSRNFTRFKVCVHKLSYIWLCAKILRVYKNKKEDYMFFGKKQSKRKMNLSRKIMAFVLAGVLLLS